MVKEMEQELRDAEKEVMEEGDSQEADEEIEEGDSKEADAEETEETNEDDQEDMIKEEEIETFIALF